MIVVTGGSYEDFHKIIHREISRLRDELGFNLEVVFDGPASPFKAQTMEMRKDKIDDDWKEFYQVIRTHTKVFNQDRLPVPPFTKLSFAVFLRREFPDILIVQSKGEADIEMGNKCNEVNNTG